MILIFLEIMLAGRAMMDVMDNVVAKHLEQEELVTKMLRLFLEQLKEIFMNSVSMLSELFFELQVIE